MTTPRHEANPPPESVEQRLTRVIDCHFDPDGGSRFWLDRQAELGIDARRKIHTPADLAMLGETRPEDLAARPLLDHIPRRFHGQLDRFVLAQTGGTTGGGTWTAYRDDEFEEAFVRPFSSAAAQVGFPRGEMWLYVGPGGPHVIGKAARRLAAISASPDPFSVDFDSRWAKRLPPDSFAFRRYLEHVLEQALEVIRCQFIGVLFTTPVVLADLWPRMTEEQRRRVGGVHYGGMAIDPGQMEAFQTAAFPEAVHLSGYGNTLFGCCLELNSSQGRPLDYFPYGSRLLLEVVDDDGAAASRGQSGRVRFTRLDESSFIVRLRECDEAVAVDVPAGAPEGYRLPGVRNPHTARSPDIKAAVGLY